MPGTCPCSFYDDSVLPGIPEVRDGVPLTLGIRFSSTTGGTLTGVRFYKSAGNTGTHTGTLFTASGQQLATVTFANESTSGWQTAYFNQPVGMSANTEYVVAYKTTTGTYSATVNGFGPGLSAGNLRTSSDAGAYSYSNDFPNARSTASYLVDVVVQYPDPPFTAAAQSPLPGSSSVALNSTVSAVFSKPVTASTVKATLTGPGTASVPGTTAFDATTSKMTFTPSAPLAAATTYTATLTATSATGQQLGAGGSWSFTTVPSPRTEGTCPCTLYQDTVTPTVMESNDGIPLVLGVRFASSAAGTITGIRFYKAAGNTGTHSGSLFTVTGQQLATVTFTGETSAGWQTATFSQPVAIAADTEYVAAYRSPSGTYSATPGGFASGFTSGPLRTAAGSGSYSYSGDFPSSGSNASYLVDLVFEQGGSTPAPPPPAPLTVTSQSPAPNATGVALSAKPSLTLSAAVQPGSALVLSAGGANVAGSSALSADARTITFSPAQQLPSNAQITASASNVISTTGASLAPTSWQFTTVNAAPAAQTLFSSMVPQVAASTDTSAMELGTAFQTTAAGVVTALRFYKGPSNTGVHTGSLWDPVGARLIRVAFANETASGWQTAVLASPIRLAVGATYVVSYNAPVGRYSYTANFFTQVWSSGVLRAPTRNGLYRLGTGTAVPNRTDRATNYFVDVVFAPDPAS